MNAKSIPLVEFVSVPIHTLKPPYLSAKFTEFCNKKFCKYP